MTRAVDVRIFDDGVDRWRVAEAMPAPALRDAVERYCGYSERTASFSARRELAATRGVMIYALGEPLEIVGADGGTIRIAAGEAFVGGIADATSLSRGLGDQRGVHVFMPIDTLARVIATPLVEVVNKVVKLRDVIGRDADDLGHALCEAASDEARFARLDAFLEMRLARASAGDPETLWALRRLATAGVSASSGIADQLGWSRKRLARSVRAATGLAPDRFRRLARFERFAALVRRRSGEGLAALAADIGYVDQAHLARDVRDFSGMTPGELRSRLIPGEGGVRHD